MTAFKTNGIETSQEMVVHILQDFAIDEAESGLDDSEHHIDLFIVFTFEKEDDIDDMVEDVTHLLGVHGFLEHLLLVFVLLLFYDFNK